MRLAYATLESPLGPVLLAGDEAGLRRIAFQGGSAPVRPAPEWKRSERLFREATRQLRAYFAGELRTFDLELAPAGTPFQSAVWRAIRMIPYGETRSYSEVAQCIGNRRATRAVGSASGRNPLPIVVPCHRLIATRGALGGYTGGLHFKRALLELERNGSA